MASQSNPGAGQPSPAPHANRPPAGTPPSPAEPHVPADFLPRIGGYLASIACRHAIVAVLLGLLISLGAGWYTVRNFALDTDVTRLFPDDLPWRKTEDAMAAAFPQRQDLIAIVIDGHTAQETDDAASRLAAALAKLPKQFPEVQRPDALPFYTQNALLFLPLDEVKSITSRLIDAQALLATLAQQPNLLGLSQALQLLAQGVSSGDADLSSMAAPLSGLADAAEGAVAGQSRPVDWEKLFTGRAPDAMELRRFVLVKPVLNFADLSPGASASDTIRQTAKELGLDAAHGVQVRLTGEIPMSDDEFASIEQGASRDLEISLVLVLGLLWLGLRSLRLIVPVLLTLIAGLILTAAFGLLVIGPFNPLSIAFAVLFIGLGVDFGIQYAVRAREARHDLGPQADLHAVLVRAAQRGEPGITLAALGIAGSFLAFMPTDYRGVSALGAIAGGGMLIAWLLSLTLLPALTYLTHPKDEKASVGWPAIAGFERRLTARPRLGGIILVVLVLIALATLPGLRFDFNPLNLRDQHSESVATFRSLMANPETTPNTLDVLAPNLTAAQSLAERLAGQPGIASARTLASFIPEDQQAKLAVIQDAADLLGPALMPPMDTTPPTDAQVVAALEATATALDKAVAKHPDTATSRSAQHAARLAHALQLLAGGDQAGRRRLAEVLMPGLHYTLRQITTTMSAHAAVTLASLPEALKAEWITPDGRARIELRPQTPHNGTGVPSNTDLRHFAETVQAIAPDASGTAISILASSTTIRHAFIQAGIIAVVGIGLLLLVALRDLRLTIAALTPLLLSLLATLATCAVLGPVLNLANIVALPLLFGIGVAFDIYYVAAWRGGMQALLPSALSRAVLFSALTTASAFGTLALSHHPGTASMGVLLGISLGWTLVMVVFALPILLRLIAPHAQRPQ